MTFVFAVTFREFECYIHPVCGLHSGRLNASFGLRNNEFRKTPNLLPLYPSNALVERD